MVMPEIPVTSAFSEQPCHLHKMVSFSGGFWSEARRHLLDAQRFLLQNDWFH